MSQKKLLWYFLIFCFHNKRELLWTTTAVRPGSCVWARCDVITPNGLHSFNATTVTESTEWLTYNLTARCRVFIQMLVAQMFNKSPSLLEPECSCTSQPLTLIYYPPPTPRPHKRCLLLRFTESNFVCISHLSHEFYMLCPSHHPWFGHSNNIRWIWVMRFLIM
jgi:hypothetical protein